MLDVVSPAHTTTVQRRARMDFSRWRARRRRTNGAVAAAVSCIDRAHAVVPSQPHTTSPRPTAAAGSDTLRARKGARYRAYTCRLEFPVADTPYIVPTFYEPPPFVTSSPTQPATT